MPYVVLARRYRPQRFEELVGQEHVVRVLQNAIKTGRIHHAYIFSGARGTGKTTTARIFAKALNCEHGPTPEPCNKCAQCVAITEGRSVDVLEIDGASHTGVDNVRNLREELKYLPTSARYKVVIIDEVHMLSTAAFNALLKTLEEPPEHVIFILATTEPHKIPATIHSRCQHFEFRRLDTPVLARHLGNILDKEGVEYEPEALRLVAIAGEGSVRDSLSILDQVLAHHVEGRVTAAEVQEVLGFVGHDMLAEVAEAVLSHDTARLLDLVKEIFEAGHDLVTFTKQLVEYFRDLIIIAAHPEPERLVAMPSEEIARARRVMEGHSLREVHVLFTRLFDGVREVGAAHSQRTALELILTEMALSEPLYPAVELLRKVEALERKLTSGSKGQTTAPQAPQRPQPPQRPQAPQRPQTGRAAPPQVQIPDLPVGGVKKNGNPAQARKRVSSPRPEPPAPQDTAAQVQSPPEERGATDGSVTGGSKQAPLVEEGAVDFSLWRRAVEGLKDLSVQPMLRSLKFLGGRVEGDTIVFSVGGDVDPAFLAMVMRSREAASAALSESLGQRVSLEIMRTAEHGVTPLSIKDMEDAEKAEEIRSMKNEALNSPITRLLMEQGLKPVHFRVLPYGRPMPVDGKESGR